MVSKLFCYIFADRTTSKVSFKKTTILTFYRVWDRLIGVSPDFIACFALVLTQTLKTDIMERTDAKAIKERLSNVSKPILKHTNSKLPPLNIESLLLKSIDLFSALLIKQ